MWQHRHRERIVDDLRILVGDEDQRVTRRDEMGEARVEADEGFDAHPRMFGFRGCDRYP